MMKVLDYYYLVIVRWFGDRLEHRGVGLMAFTFTINLISLVILVNPTFDIRVIFICWVIIGIVINIALDIIYNKKRREMIREKYKDEDYDSYYCGMVKVVLYEILSVAFFVFAIWWSFS